MTPEQTEGKVYCNVLAIQKGIDPGGHASSFDRAVVFETPLPWKKTMYDAAGVLPQEILDLYDVWLERYHAGLGYRNTALVVAPDPAYSREGYRRVMFYTRPSGAFANFEKLEYLVPTDMAGALMWAYFEAPDDLPRYEAYRETLHDKTRDLLVCTHGTVDSACAKFGYPLYNLLRKKYADENLRVWRVSHFGGHIFAPTLMDMPLGHYWAYVEDAQAEQIVRREGDAAAMRGHYRGWAGVESGLSQFIERELWQRYGWDWFQFAKSCAVLNQDEGEDPLWIEVRLEFASPDGSIQGAVEARAEVASKINTISTTGKDYTYDYEQYAVTRITDAVGV